MKPSAVSWISLLMHRYYVGTDHPMKRRFWHWVRTATGYPRLGIRYSESGWLTLDERDLVQKEVFLHGYYEPEVWEALFSVAEGSEILWDIGAHVGTFTVRSMLDSRVAAIHAFEPDPVTRRALKSNVDLNRILGSQCDIHDLAIGADTGVSTLHRGPANNTGLSSIALQAGVDTFAVQRTSIDELIFRLGYAPPSLMKIDIEGAEADLLRGAERFLKECRPKAIVIEAEAEHNGVIIDQSIVGPLVAAGYQINWIRRPGDEIWQRENYLAVRAAS